MVNEEPIYYPFDPYLRIAQESGMLKIHPRKLDRVLAAMLPEEARRYLQGLRRLNDVLRAAFWREGWHGGFW